MSVEIAGADSAFDVTSELSPLTRSADSFAATFFLPAGGFAAAFFFAAFLAAFFAAGFFAAGFFAAGFFAAFLAAFFFAAGFFAAFLAAFFFAAGFFAADFFAADFFLADFFLADFFFADVAIARQDRAASPRKAIAKFGLRVPAWSLALTLIACPWWATAHAGQPSPDELAREAEAHREAGEAAREGRAGGDPEGFAKCATAYLALLELDGGRTDELLWNAAECAAAADQLGQAMQIWRTIVDEHPSSPLAGPAMLRLADSSAAIARYGDAAEQLERFATSFPRDAAAPDALHNAYLLRVGLEQRNAALDDLDDYERLYARREPERGAAIFWSRIDLLESDKQRREHALDYLRTYGNEGGLDRVVVAEALIAQIDWRKSCRGTMVLDACVAIEREPKRPLHPNLANALARTAPASESSDGLPKRCGDASQPIYKPLRRDAKLAAGAQDRFARVLDLVAKAGAAIPADQVDRANAFADAWGMALVYRNDLRLEQLIAFELPTKLDFTVERWRKDSGVHAWEKAYFEQLRTRDDSDKRLLTALEEQHRLVTELLANATEVRSSGSVEWTFVGLAHAAMGQQALSGHLRRATLPNTLRRKVQANAYCERLAAQAEPIETELSKLLMYCVERATEYQYFDAAARWCEAELSRIDVARYPRTDELFGSPSATPAGPRSFGVQADPDVLPESATMQ